jgi:hypothetical protein
MKQGWKDEGGQQPTQDRARVALLFHLHLHHHPFAAAITLLDDAMALSGIDKSRFGTGYLSDGEKSGTFVFTSGGIRFDDKQGVGGSTPVQGYDGRWPIFGKTEDSWEAHAAAATSASTSGKGAVKAKQGGPRMICKGTGRCSACPKNEVRGAECSTGGFAF